LIDNFLILADIFLADCKDPPKELMTTNSASDCNDCI